MTGLPGQVQKRFTLNAKGSATLELTIVFPVMFLIFFSLVFFSMHLYQKLIMLESASYTATQASATWDNSNKEIEDGFLPAWNFDGLYWRITSDTSGSDLTRQKTDSTVSFLQSRLEPGMLRLISSSGPESSVVYENSWISRKITASVKSRLFIPASPFVRPLLGDSANISVRSDVAEPVEFIRNCDLGGEYLKKIADYIGAFGKEGDAGEKVVLIGSTYSYAGSKVEKIYHYPGCQYIGRIKEQRQFNSVSEAKAAGYHLCLKCAERELKMLEKSSKAEPDSLKAR